jgi:subtilisin family serine protease
VPGRVLVVDDAGRLERGPRGELRARQPSLTGLLAKHGLSRCAALWRGAPASRTRCYALESSQPDFDPVLAAEELRATGLVRAAVPDLRLRLHVVPNDPDVPIQWYVDDGSVADVRLPAAWNVEKGSPAVRIGVMDTGVDLGHPDLASKIWTNPGEIDGNAVDDDGNGYVDDVHGWDFGDGDDDPNPHAVPDPDAYDVDVGFHGTFVAAIAAAAPDNGEGIAGAAWNCRVVPLKVVNSAGDITLEAMTEAFAYATAKHLEVLNVSLGTPAEPGVAEYFQALVDAATAAGVLVVASAGNSGTADPNYPAACEGVLSVAATDETNARASFSSFGPTVRIAAPGSGMWSAICRNYTIDDFSLLFYEVFFYWDGERPYMLGDGTSFSAPLVSGTCALVRSRHPGWPPLTVASHMVGTGDAVAYDEPIGPRLDAFRAVTEDAVSVPVTPVGAYALDVTPNPSTADARIRFTLPVGGETRLRVYDCAGRLVRELASGAEPAGEHVFSWDGADSQGRQPSAGVYVMRLDTPMRTLRRKFVRTR